MLPFGVTIQATVPQRSEIPEGLTNYPVCTLPVLFLLGVRVSNYIEDCKMTVELSIGNDGQGSIPCLMWLL